MEQASATHERAVSNLCTDAAGGKLGPKTEARQKRLGPKTENWAAQAEALRLLLPKAELQKTLPLEPGWEKGVGSCLPCVQGSLGPAHSMPRALAGTAPDCSEEMEAEAGGKPRPPL